MDIKNNHIAVNYSRIDELFDITEEKLTLNEQIKLIELLKINDFAKLWSFFMINIYEKSHRNGETNEEMSSFKKIHEEIISVIKLKKIDGIAFFNEQEDCKSKNKVLIFYKIKTIIKAKHISISEFQKFPYEKDLDKVLLMSDPDRDLFIAKINDKKYYEQFVGDRKIKQLKSKILEIAK